MRPLPSSQRCASPPGQGRHLAAPQPTVGQDRHQGQVEAGALGGLRWRFEAAAAGTGVKGGVKTYHWAVDEQRKYPG